jgi:hypothetical protein
MLKQYIINGKQYQYREGEQPEGAVELKKAVKPPEKAAEPPVKVAEPKNKAVRPANKTRRAVRK